MGGAYRVSSEGRASRPIDTCHSFLVLALVAWSLSVPTGTSAAELRGRGVYYFDGPVRSPLAGIGARGDFATNRIALDDDYTVVAVDADARRIVFTNSHRYASTTIIGDLVVLGLGSDGGNGDVPFSVHLKVEKRGDSFKASLHPHPTARVKLSNIRVGAYTVVARGGSVETTLLTPEQTKNAIEEPELAARLANLFIQATDHLEGHTIVPERADARLVDVSIGFGIKMANLKVGRIELISRDAANATLIRQASLIEMLQRGAWEFRITSKTWLPQSEFTRDLFLFGLDSIGFLQRLKKDGLRRGELFAVGFHDGHGFVQLGGDRAEIANPADVARAYMEFHFIGGIVARQIATIVPRLAQLP